MHSWVSYPSWGKNPPQVAGIPRESCLAHLCGFQMWALGCWVSFVWRKTLGFLVCSGSPWCYQAASDPSQAVSILHLQLHSLAALDPKGLLYGREARTGGVCTKVPLHENPSLWAVWAVGLCSDQWRERTPAFVGFTASFLLHLNSPNVRPLSF